MSLHLRAIARDPAVRTALVLFIVARVVLSVWAVIVLTILPPPAEANEAVRPYLGEPHLVDGAAGLLLGSWQRFDTMHYLALARHGYDVPNSVFPPLYPLAIRALGSATRFLTGLSRGEANLLAAMALSNLALLAALILLYRMTLHELGEGAATRALVYLVLFPVGVFLFAAYTESLFLLFALGAVWSARRERPLLAGILGLLAALTRLTGWGLVAPLAYEYARQRGFDWRRLNWRGLSVLLPPLGLVAFLAWRAAADLPPLSAVYRDHWFQTTGIPGADLLVALKTVATGAGPRAGEFTLLFDLFTLALLLLTTAVVFRRLGMTYGLYSLMMLLFMLLPSSDLKPLFSFSRYALAFFPTFMVLAAAGRNPWLNRLILYPSVALFLYFSGQFFVWGWVA
jgi:hypothetical protein